MFLVRNEFSTIVPKCRQGEHYERVHAD